MILSRYFLCILPGCLLMCCRTASESNAAKGTMEKSDGKSARPGIFRTPARPRRKHGVSTETARISAHPPKEYVELCERLRQLPNGTLMDAADEILKIPETAELIEVNTSALSTDETYRFKGSTDSKSRPPLFWDVTIVWANSLSPEGKRFSSFNTSHDPKNQLIGKQAFPEE
jgi:hypothetical protein